MYAPTSEPLPASIDDVIALTGAETNEVQTITVTGSPTGGVFSLTFDGEQTADIPYNASAAAVKAALDALYGIETGDVVTAGGPLPATPVTVTFGGRFAGRGVGNLAADATGLTGGTTPAIGVAETTPGAGLYSPVGGWLELGATREGIQVELNNTETGFDIDQAAGEVGTAPDTWECFVNTRLAEMTLEHLVFAWEGVPITTDLVNNHRKTAFAGATSYTERRLAILFMKPNGKLWMLAFHRAVRSPQAGTLDFRKGGNAMDIQTRFKILADPSVTDPRGQFFDLYEQL